MTSKLTGEQLRMRRNELQLTLEQLSAQSGVNQKTISQIENSRRKRGARKSTLRKLASCLKMNLEQPEKDSLPQKPASDDSPFEVDLVQMNVRVPSDVRNMWTLLALRYGIGITRLVEIAPLALFLAAEGSLAYRRERLEELYRRVDALKGAGTSFPDWPLSFLTSRWELDEAISDEQYSIAAHDLFGTKVLHSEAFHLEDRSEGEANPFFAYLKERLAALDQTAELLNLDSRSGSYSLCKEDIDQLVGGDEEAAKALAAGQVLLHEMPRTLLQEGPAEQRTAWVKEKLAVWREEDKARWARFLDLDLNLDSNGKA